MYDRNVYNSKPISKKVLKINVYIYSTMLNITIVSILTMI